MLIWKWIFNPARAQKERVLWSVSDAHCIGAERQASGVQFWGGHNMLDKMMM